MRKSIHPKNTLSLFRFIQFDLVLTIILLLLISFSGGGESLLKALGPRLALVVLLLGAAIGLSIAARSSLALKFEEALTAFSKNTRLQFISILAFGILAGCLLWIPKQNIVFNLLPLLILAWLVGGQVLLLFQGQAGSGLDETRVGHYQKVLAICSLLGVYLFLALPSRLPGIFNGIPWSSTPEFIFAALLIPLSFIFGWRLYGRKTVFAGILVLCLLRVVVTFSMPEAGLAVRAYQTPADLQADTWHKTYSSALGYSDSDVMQTPYRGLYEFPADWLTRQKLVTTPQPWLGLSLQGFARLGPGERLIFLTNGLSNGKITLTGKDGSFDATILNAADTTSDFTSNSPEPKSFSISGQLVFTDSNDYQLTPLILRADNTTRPAFEGTDLWLSDSIARRPAGVVSFTFWLVWLQNIVLAGLVIACLLSGVFTLIRRHQVRPLEIHLGVSGAFFLPLISKLWLTFSLYIPKNKLAQTLQFSAIFLIFYCMGMLLMSAARPAGRSKLAKGFLLSSGLVVFSLIFMLYYDSFRQFTVFSTLDDAFEYQNFARNIFVNQDFLLLATPPRAYKILFPYMVGFLHMLFGQSSSAQVFLNTWCSLLTGMLLIKIGERSDLRASIAQATGGLLVLLLLGNYFFFYFQFGLIEPPAVLCLVCFFYLAQEKWTPGMLLAGIATILLRLDYAGAVLAGLVLTSAPISGSLQQAWSHTLFWAKTAWRQVTAQAIILVLPAAGIIVAYNLLTKNYMLNASDTAHTGLGSILEGWMRVILGGNPDELKTLFLASPLLTTLTTFVLLAGTLSGVAPLVWRKGRLTQMDLRWGLVMLGLLSVYLVVRPTGYAPRFSTALLPLAILTLASFANEFWKIRPVPNQGDYL